MMIKIEVFTNGEWIELTEADLLVMELERQGYTVNILGAAKQ